MSDQGRRLRQREEDIESLEVALNDLKSSMITEMEIKNREYQTLQRAFDDHVRANDSMRSVITNLTNDLDSSLRMINELQQHNESFVEKNDYLESVINELEDKNKKMTELLN